MKLLTVGVCSAVFFLSGCAMTVQNPSSSLKPVNAVALEGDARVMLHGHDVVAYFTQGKHALGSKAHSSTYQEVTFRFANAEHKALFDKEPAKYLPQFGGYCANGMVYGIPWGGDADQWAIVDGKLTIFGGVASKEAFYLDPLGNMKLAQQYWKDEVAGNNSFIQRAKRLVFKVPHYKGGEQLAKEVAKSKEAKPK